MFHFTKKGKMIFGHSSSLRAAMETYSKLKADPYTTLQRSTNATQMEESLADDRHSMDWTGCTSEAHFMELLKKGDKETAQKIRRLSSPDVHLQSIRRKPKRGETGDALDMTAVYRGEPEKAWLSSVKAKRDGGKRYITLAVNAGNSCGVDSDELSWRGLSALRIADTLSEAGYFVRLLSVVNAANMTDTGSYSLIYTTVLKDFDEYLNLPKLASVIGRSAFFRRVGFAAIIAAADSQGVTVDYGLGRPFKFDSDKWKDAMGGEDWVTIPECKDEKSCESVINDVLLRF